MPKPKQVIPTSSNGSGTANLYLIAKNAQEQMERDKEFQKYQALRELLTPIHQKIRQKVLAETFEQDLVKTAENGKESHPLHNEIVSSYPLSGDEDTQKNDMRELAFILENILVKDPDIAHILNNEGRSMRIGYQSAFINQPNNVHDLAPRLSVSLDFIQIYEPENYSKIVTPKEKKKKCNLL